jgi:hypothetical protein
MARRILLFLVVALLVGITSDGRAAKAKWVGVVLPNDVRPGERGSGSIVLYPAAVQSLSGLTVTKAPLEHDDDKSRKAALKGFVVKTTTQTRPADEDFVVDVPPGASSVHVTISENDQDVAQVDLPVESLSSAPLTCGDGDWIAGTEADGTQSNYKMPPILCYAGMGVISGDFSGDGRATQVMFGTDAARILGESRRFCYFLVPSSAPAGKTDVHLYEGVHQVTFHESIPRMDLVQQLEDGSIGSAPPPSGDAENSDDSGLALPLGVGIGVGAGAIGGGGGDSDFGVEHGHIKPEE